MLNPSVFKYAVTLLFLLFANAITLADITGRIATVVGQATITSGTTTRSVFKGDLIHRGEIITTLDNNAKTHLLLTDGSRIVLYPQSQLTINQYFFDANLTTNNMALLTLTKGSIRLISGDMVKKSPQKMQLNTLIGTVDAGKSDYNATLKNDSLILSVQQGTINFVNTQGDTNISQGQTFQFFAQKIPMVAEAIALEPFLTAKAVKETPVATNGDKNRPRLDSFSNYKQFLQAMYLYRKSAEEQIKPRIIINNLPSGHTKPEDSTIEGDYDINYWHHDMDKTMANLSTLTPYAFSSNIIPNAVLRMNLLSTLEMENVSIDNALNQPVFLLSDFLELNDDELGYLIKKDKLNALEEQYKKEELLSYLLKKSIKNNAQGNDIRIIGTELGQPDISVINRP